jgi:hypothetical protein
MAHDCPTSTPSEKHALARRTVSDSGELAYYVCFAPAHTRW